MPINLFFASVTDDYIPNPKYIKYFCDPRKNNFDVIYLSKYDMY